MDISEKLSILADAAKYDASCASSGSKRKNQGGVGNTEGMGICHSYTPDGRCISLLKLLLTNYCIYDCTYCINRSSSDVKRARFTPEEVIWLTLEFYKRNYIEGLFLSSGVLRTPDDTMSQMISVAQKLRRQHKYGGYIHLKAVAGASAELVEKAGFYADRVSANIELPTQDGLSVLAAAKSHQQIEEVMTLLKEKRNELTPQAAAKQAAAKVKPPIYLPAGQSTQIIVGATADSDATVLQKSTQLYSEHKLRRVYYTAFSPIPHSDSRLPLQAPPMMREQRLYQADWLLRFYGFNVGELTEKSENLDLERDPKLSWALRHPEFFPIKINTAPKEWLLRVPGFGVRTVERILKVRRFRKLTLADLKKMKTPLVRAKFFIVTDESESFIAPRMVEKKDFVKPVQLDLFDATSTALTGEL